MSVVFKNNAPQVTAAMANAIQRGLDSIGMTAEGYAKKETPVDTGRLRNSISHATDSDSAYIGTNVKYAPYVELGANGRPGKHMLQRASTEHTAEYQRIMEDSLKNA